MNDQPPHAPAYSFRSAFMSPAPSATVSRLPIEGQSKQSPYPASPSPQQKSLPAPDYDRFISKFHQHTLSDSTNNAASNESSPTTTISTVDDSSATEPSPGSSPESPPPTTFAVGMLRPRTADDSRRPFFELQKQPPPRKGRNLKNLAVNTSRQPRAASTTSLPLRVQPEPDSTIFSPSFVKPPTPPRRRPSALGLTIQTPGGSKPPPQEVRLTIPPTPGFGRPGTLRHFQSSPSLPLVSGLSLPHNNLGTDYSTRQTLETIFSPVERIESTPIDEELEGEEEQNFDVPLSREEKPEAYPDGPICVYDPSIDLYLEPTAEQARKYDVIMNVASEVRNPFLQHSEPATAEPDLRLDGGGGIQYAPKRNRGTTNVESDLGPKTTAEVTPKAKLTDTDATEKEPEYIHVPWEHNSDIVPDLLRLVKVIDEKVDQRKRVLIHCQCGVSRSASLVVAYGLYKSPSMSVQEAYDAVKKRSKWIGPNMNLIMQLQEFRSSLARGGILAENRSLSPLTPSSTISDWRSPFSREKSADIPMSATVAPRDGESQDLAAVSPGPSSAPSGFAWPLSSRKCDQAISTSKQATAYVDPSGHVVPALQVSATEPMYSSRPVRRLAPEEDENSSTPTEAKVSSPRSAEFAMAPLQPSNEADPADRHGILSPTSTEFASNPFDRSALLASLGMGSMRADEETPRRSLSLRHRDRPLQPPGSESKKSELQPRRQLRGKISSPTLREQHQLQSLQAKIEASLPVRHNGSPHQQHSPLDDGPMSPRATEFTNNPFALSSSIPSEVQENLNAPRASTTDPRSPAHKGASPIIRNILDFL